MKNINQKSGYTIVISLLLVGLLLILSTGILNMILNETKDNRSMGNYIKAYAGAESAQELVLLKIKEKGYGYYDKIDHNINNRSVLLSDNPLDYTKFNKVKDILISYDMGNKVSSYSGTITALKYEIIPLFYMDETGEHKITNLSLSILEGNDSDLAWNIIGLNRGISGEGLSTTGIEKSLVGGELKYSETSINNFLSNSSSNYLVLFNTSNSQIIKYNLVSNNNSEYFSRPKTSIISSGEVGSYKQNLETILDNSKFLNIQKYAIYSN